MIHLNLHYNGCFKKVVFFTKKLTFFGSTLFPIGAAVNVKFCAVRPFLTDLQPIEIRNFELLLGVPTKFKQVRSNKDASEVRD